MGRDGSADATPVRGDAKPSQGLDQRQIGLTNAVMIQALAAGDSGDFWIEKVSECAYQCALTDPRLTRHEYGLASTRTRLPKAALELLHFRGAPNELPWRARSSKRHSRKWLRIAHCPRRNHQPVTPAMLCLDVKRAPRVVPQGMT